MSHSELDRSLRAFRASLRQRERQSFAVLRGAYRVALKAVQADLALATETLARFDDPDDPSFDKRGRFTEAGMRRFRQRRLTALLDLVETEFARYSRQAAGVIDLDQRRAAADGAAQGRQLILAGLGPAPPGVSLPFVGINRAAVIDLTAAVRPEAPVGRLIASMAGEARQTVGDLLTSGVIQGRNARQIAGVMAAALDGQRTRALTISRTETQRAYRSATLATLQANRHLLNGWRWSSARDRRTCPACLSLDGRVFDVDTPMRAHVSCRCSMSPVAKSWKDLGVDVPEPAVRRASGADWFARQPAAVQRDTLGPAAQAAYASGEVTLDDFVRLRRSRTWGSSYVRGSLAGAMERAAQRRRRPAA